MKRILKLSAIAFGLNLCLAMTTSARLPGEHMEADLERRAQPEKAKKTRLSDDNVILGQMETNEKEEKQVSEKNITLTAGHEGLITLPSNRSTGNSWRLKYCTPKDMINVSESKYVINITPTNSIGTRLGEGGKEQFTITAINNGSSKEEKAKCIFEYVRPWEINVAPYKSITYSIMIKPNLIINN